MASLVALNSKVLMLGAGFVTKPTLDILSDAGISVSVGTYHRGRGRSSRTTITSNLPNYAFACPPPLHPSHPLTLIPFILTPLSTTLRLTVDGLPAPSYSLQDPHLGPVAVRWRRQRQPHRP